MTPDYWQRAARELAAADEHMAELVERYAGLGLVSRGDPFGTLARSIVGQQISVKAADAVWGVLSRRSAKFRLRRCWRRAKPGWLAAACRGAKASTCVTWQRISPAGGSIPQTGCQWTTKR